MLPPCHCRWGGRPIQDWADLLQPRLKGKVAFQDSPREFVAIALRTLGLPWNATSQDVDLAGLSLRDLRERVEQLRKQVQADAWLQPCRGCA